MNLTIQRAQEKSASSWQERIIISCTAPRASSAISSSRAVTQALHLLVVLGCSPLDLWWLCAASHRRSWSTLSPREPPHLIMEEWKLHNIAWRIIQADSSCKSSWRAKNRTTKAKKSKSRKMTTRAPPQAKTFQPRTKATPAKKPNLLWQKALLKRSHNRSLYSRYSSHSFRVSSPRSATATSCSSLSLPWPSSAPWSLALPLCLLLLEVSSIMWSSMPPESQYYASISSPISRTSSWRLQSSSRATTSGDELFVDF